MGLGCCVRNGRVRESARRAGLEPYGIGDDWEAAWRTSWLSYPVVMTASQAYYGGTQVNVGSAAWHDTEIAAAFG